MNYSTTGVLIIRRLNKKEEYLKTKIIIFCSIIDKGRNWRSFTQRPAKDNRDVEGKWNLLCLLCLQFHSLFHLDLAHSSQFPCWQSEAQM